jgi:hypothetical protein
LTCQSPLALGNYNPTLLFDGVYGYPPAPPTSYYWNTSSTWVQIQLPVPILLDHFIMNPLSNTGGTYPYGGVVGWYMQGSTDGSNWSNVNGSAATPTTSSSSGVSGTYQADGGGGLTVQISGVSTKYNYYRLNFVNSGANNYLKQWQIFGSQ